MDTGDTVASGVSKLRTQDLATKIRITESHRSGIIAHEFRFRSSAKPLIMFKEQILDLI